MNKYRRIIRQNINIKTSFHKSCKIITAKILFWMIWSLSFIFVSYKGNCEAFHNETIPYSGANTNNKVVHDYLPAIYEKFTYIKNVAILQFYSGKVFVKRQNQSAWVKPLQQQTIISNDIIQTQSDGYAVISYSTNNIILLKPNSTIGVSVINEEKLLIRCYKASIYVISFPPSNLHIETYNGFIKLDNGEGIIYTDNKKITILCMNNKLYFYKNSDNANKPLELNEGNYLTLNGYNHSSSNNLDYKHSDIQLGKFDTSLEFRNWRRFEKFIDHFRNLHKKISITLAYKIDNVTINGKYLNHYEVDSNGFFIIDSGNYPIPRVLSIKARFTPYPRPNDKFQLELDHNIIYALREFPDGLYGVNFETPSFPEFSLKIFYLCDQTSEKHKLFEAKFRLLNKAAKKEEINNFFSLLKNEFERRNFINIREMISHDYRDMFGNNYVDFINSLESSLKNLRDIRVSLYPRSYNFINTKEVCVQANYRVSALKSELGTGWDLRYEDRGNDVFTLVKENGKWKIISKQEGKFFQLIKVALDLSKGVVKGRVTDERTNMPLQNALVKILKTPYQVYTDFNGEYIFYNVPPGKYDIEISKNGYAKLTISNIEVLPVGRTG